MGLDTTHDAWHGAYSAFSRWRDELVVAAGYRSDRSDIAEWNDSLTIEEVAGKWKRELDEPLVYLLWHSDCDGVIRPKQAVLIADRLTELLPRLPETDDPGHIGNWRAKTQRFIDGLRRASAEGKKVKFF